MVLVLVGFSGAMQAISSALFTMSMSVSFGNIVLYSFMISTLEPTIFPNIAVLIRSRMACFMTRCKVAARNTSSCGVSAHFSRMSLNIAPRHNSRRPVICLVGSLSGSSRSASRSRLSTSATDLMAAATSSLRWATGWAASLVGGAAAFAGFVILFGTKFLLTGFCCFWLAIFWPMNDFPCPYLKPFGCWFGAEYEGFWLRTGGGAA